MNEHQINRPSPTSQVDLTNCDREPIHRLGRIQSFGFLVAVSDDWIIQYVSENCETWMGAPADALIGQPLHDFAARNFVHAVRNHVQHLTGPDDIERAFGLQLIEGGRSLRRRRACDRLADHSRVRARARER